MSDERSIPIHPEKGLNPFLTYCPKCYGEAQELVMVGSNDGIYECDGPSAEGGPHRMYGKPTPSLKDGNCPACGRRARWTRVGTLEDGQRLPATQPCDKCKAQEDVRRAEVEAGGIYVICVDCKSEAIAKAGSGFAKLARENYQKQEGSKFQEGWFTTPMHTKGNAKVYTPLGAEISKAMGCPRCGQLEQEKKLKGDANAGGQPGTSPV